MGIGFWVDVFDGFVVFVGGVFWAYSEAADVMALSPKMRMPHMPPMMKTAVTNRVRFAVASGERVTFGFRGGGG